MNIHEEMPTAYSFNTDSAILTFCSPLRSISECPSNKRFDDNTWGNHVKFLKEKIQQINEWMKEFITKHHGIE
jgi:hypothetical protein